MVSPTWRKTLQTEVLRVTAQEELNSVNDHLSDPVSRSFPNWALRWQAAPADTLIGNLYEILKTQLSDIYISDPQKLWNNIVLSHYILGQFVTQL